MRRWLLAEQTAQMLLRAGAQRLTAAGIETPRLDAEVLLAHVCQVERLTLLSNVTAQIAAQEQARFWDVLDRRSSQEPVAYITRFAEFWSHEFRVKPGILIPRSDSEILVEMALQSIPQDQPVHFVDLGTGSGCLALSILTERPQATAIGIDISETAIQVAQDNAARLGLSSRFQTQCEKMEIWLQTATRFELVISNPPYIDQPSYDALAKGVKDFEPRSALQGGKDGLLYYRHLAQLGPRALTPGGKIIVEIAYDQKAAVTALFQASFKTVECVQDLAGRDRVIIAS